TAYAAGHPVLYVFGDPDAGDAALVDVSSFRVTESTLVVPPPAPQQLLHYTGAHQNVIAELQAGGLIPSGRTPTLVVQEPLFASEGSGMIYEALAEDAPHADVVIAAALEARFNA